MIKGDAKAKLRSSSEKNYHDIVFEEEINELINVTKSHYEAYVILSFENTSYI